MGYSNLVRQKQLRQALLLILLSVSDNKRGYTSLYFIILNFRTELNLSLGMNSLAFAPYTMFANYVAIGTPYCFDQVQLKVSFFMQFRWFALTHFFGLHIKSLIHLKIVSATFGIGGELLPSSPSGYTPARNAFCQAKAEQSHQHTDSRRIQPEYEKYRMRNTLRSAGQSFSQPMLHVPAQRITVTSILTLTLRWYYFVVTQAKLVEPLTKQNQRLYLQNQAFR